MSDMSTDTIQSEASYEADESGAFTKKTPNKMDRSDTFRTHLVNSSSLFYCFSRNLVFFSIKQMQLLLLKR